MQKIKGFFTYVLLLSPLIIVSIVLVTGVAQSIHYATAERAPAPTVDYMKLVAELAGPDSDEGIYTYDDTPMTVYVVQKGKKYHYNPDCSNMKSPRALSIDEATDEGYSPCQNCFN